MTPQTTRTNIADFDDLTLAQAMPFLRLARERQGANSNDYDLSGLRSIDSSAVATLLAIAREARATNGNCRFLNPPDSLTKLARLYGVEDILFKS